jgi:hypothetical protein
MVEIVEDVEAGRMAASRSPARQPARLPHPSGRNRRDYDTMNFPSLSTYYDALTVAGVPGRLDSRSRFPTVTARPGPANYIGTAGTGLLVNQK